MAREESLPLLLKQLALPMMLQYWEASEQQAQEKQWSYAQYLAHLAEMEANGRYQKRVTRYTKASCLPPGKSLATFDFVHTPSINQQKVHALADNPAWVKDAHNLIIFGPSGVGKTHLASAIGHRMIEHGMRCLFTETTSLVQKLQYARQQYKLPDMLAKLSRIPLIILDDIGYVKKDDMETSVLFELIAHRYEHASLIITANQPFADWDAIFPDNMMAVAAIDRLIHHATILNIKEKSFRKTHAKQKQ